MEEPRRDWRVIAAVIAAILISAGVLIVAGANQGGGTGTTTGTTTSSGTATRPAGNLTSPVFSPGPPAPSGPPPLTLGVNVNHVFNEGYFGPAAIDAQLRALRAEGVTDARADAFWEATEPTAPVNGVHAWHWAFDDKVAIALARHGIRWLPIIDYSAVWAESVPGQDHSGPTSAAAYAAYAGAFAARYGATGRFWQAHPELTRLPVQVLEIWNEPDGAFWRPVADPAGYANMYAAARAQAKAADPSMRVIIGGLDDPNTFVPRMLRARPDLKGHIDGVGIHPYGPNPPTIIHQMHSNRSVLDFYGLSGVPIYITEFGWTTKPAGAENYLPESQRPGYIHSTLDGLAHTDCTIAAVFFYTWVTAQRNPADREDWFGVHPPHGGATPDTRALAAGLAAARAKRAATRTCFGI